MLKSFKNLDNNVSEHMKAPTTKKTHLCLITYSTHMELVDSGFRVCGYAALIRPSSGRKNIPELDLLGTLQGQHG